MIAFYQYIYLTDLAYAYLGLLIAFSIAQLFLLQQRNRVQIALWIGASFFSALGTAFAPHLLTVFSVKDFGVWGGGLCIVWWCVTLSCFKLRSSGLSP